MHVVKHHVKHRIARSMSLSLVVAAAQSMVAWPIVFLEASAVALDCT